MANIKQCINTPSFSFVTNRLRNFFLKRGWVEAHPQSRLSILAACEDPTTLRTFDYSDNTGDKTWPLPQTGQMWLEWELLTQPELPGVFSVGTSYRQEPNPVPGRHLPIFPMFEFEMHGGVSEMKQLQTELLQDLGYPLPETPTKIMTALGKDSLSEYPSGDYDDVAHVLSVDDVDNKEESLLCEEHPVFFLEKFPERTAPFWNMARYPVPAPTNGQHNPSTLPPRAEPTHSKKIDVILSGQETIGSAERSCDPDQMYRDFHQISDGEYSELLFRLFGKDRVQRELDQFLSHDFFPRSGGGIGITRLMRSIAMADLKE